MCFGPCFGTEAVLRSVLRSVLRFRVRVHVRVRVRTTEAVLQYLNHRPKRTEAHQYVEAVLRSVLRCTSARALVPFFGTLWSVLCFRVKVNDKRLHRHSTVTRQKAASLTPVLLLHSLTRKVCPKTFRQNLQNSISVTQLAYLNQHTVPMVDTICGFAL